MDKPLGPLDHHFDFPPIATVDGSGPLRWLRSGWDDLRDNPVASLGYGVVYAALGFAILAFAAGRPYLFTASISGFMLVGPLAAAGLYVISRERQQGGHAGFGESLSALRGHSDSLLHFAFLLAIVLILWERISAILFALFYRDNIPDLANFYSHVVLSGQYLDFMITYLVIGGALAALVFALSVVSVPMMMDRDTDMITAMMTSLRVISLNPGTMARWAAIIVALMAVAFATMMIGMVILLPLLGHASWHAYKDLVH